MSIERHSWRMLHIVTQVVAFLLTVVIITCSTGIAPDLIMAATPVADFPYLLQVHGFITETEQETILSDALWLTEQISQREADLFMTLQERNFGRSYRLLALDAADMVLSEHSFFLRYHQPEFKLELVLPPGTASVEIRTPDGSLVSNSRQHWPEVSFAPIMSDLEVISLGGNQRNYRLRWVSNGVCDGYSLWYAADGMVWYLLDRTNFTTAVVSLEHLPGGLLSDDCGEFRVIASLGLASSEISRRYPVPWQVPEVDISGVIAGEVLEYSREEAIELRASVWDPQEKWAIYDRIIWLDEHGAIIASGGELIMPGSRFPVGRYVISAMSMNEQTKFGGFEVVLSISASAVPPPEIVVTAKADPIDLLLPLRWVLEEAGWGVVYDGFRGEITLNNYHQSFTVQPNGDLWLNGLYLGQMRLQLIEGQNWLPAEDLLLIGIALPRWDDDTNTLILKPR